MIATASLASPGQEILPPLLRASRWFPRVGSVGLLRGHLERPAVGPERVRRGAKPLFVGAELALPPALG
jgi:hypothetical protein